MAIEVEAFKWKICYNFFQKAKGWKGQRIGIGKHIGKSHIIHWIQFLKSFCGKIKIKKYEKGECT